MKLFLIFILLIIRSKFGISSSESWRWVWYCNSETERCKKISTSFLLQVQDEITYNTLATCRLICGPNGALWPKPTIQAELGKVVLPFSPKHIDYIFPTTNNEKLKYLNEIVNIFENNLMQECKPKCATNDTGYQVTIHADTSYDSIDLLPSTDESYSLEISTKESNIYVTILAPTVYGVRHGFETLTQLITKEDDFVNQNNLVIISEARIKDKPVFQHRGLLLDTGRNFLPISAIERQLDAMAASKLNVLHWHATDSQSFPLDLPKVPQLARYGAYSPEQTYKKTDIIKLKTYAQYRGVRLLIEIDAPSHAGNGWQWGEDSDLGKLAVCVNQQPWRKYCIQPPCGQLNPANQNVYKVLSKLYRDLLDVITPGEYFHMGGDEVFLPCWNSTYEILMYMAEKGMGRTPEDFLKLWAEYQDKALKVYDSVVKNRQIAPVVLWSSYLTEAEHIEKYLSKDRYIIQTWVPSNNELPQQLLERGYRLIISTKDSWYLDHGFWGTTTYHNWREAYRNKIPRQDGVLGGEVCMWGELVEDTCLDSRVWPRAAAVGERLWTDPITDMSEAELRFYTHRERLVRRGISAEALAPRWCLQNEGECQ